MKILKYKDFIFEKMKIVPISNDELDNVKTADFNEINQKKIDEQINRDVNLIKQGINKYCKYSSMGINGVPNGAGELLVKYGKDHEYQIRDKHYSVDGTPNAIIITWVTQDIDETNGENISGMFSELIRKIGIDPIYDIILLSDVRDDYSPSDPNYKYKYAFKYDSDIEEFESIDDYEEYI